MVDDASRVTAAQMDKWCRDFDNWAICDTVCFKLFDQVAPELAFRKVAQWSKGTAGVIGGNDEFVTRGALALLACVALHNEAAEDRLFLKCLPLVEQAARDKRNFVKKGVSWALRGLGVRNASLKAAVLTVARRLADSADATERWVGKDVVRQLE